MTPHEQETPHDRQSHRNHPHPARQVREGAQSYVSADAVGGEAKIDKHPDIEDAPCQKSPYEYL